MSQFVIRGGREGYERLQLLARARRGDTLDLLEHVGFPTDARCLEFLLQHLSQPRELVKRMWAAVRPGGRLVIEDADFDGLFCWPPNEGFSFYARMYPHVLELRGGDPASGRKLYGYFLDAGIPSPQVRLAQGFGTSGDTKMLALATLEATAEPIVAAGLASEDEVRAAVDSLSAYAGDATTVIGDPRVFQVWAVRQGASKLNLSRSS
jgi:SAM-dependent methyltransferase